MIENETLLKVISSGNRVNVKAPGLLDSHYSPKAKVVLNGLVLPGDGFLALDNIPTPVGATRLATPLTIEKFAMELYGALRAGDQKGVKRIVVVPPEGEGIAEGIRDRISKAASG
jgi:L-threonylcarbamoyladenylate synthase